MLLRIHFFLIRILCSDIIGIDDVRISQFRISVFRYSLWRMLCNYIVVGCDVAYVRSSRKTDDDVASHFRKKEVLCP